MKRRTTLKAMLLLFVAFAVTALAADSFQMTANGVLYKDLKTGSGDMAEVGDVATMHFIGWLDDEGRKGKELYNTHQQGAAVSFVVGTDRVLQGWNEGVIGMRPGGKRLLKVPPSLAYGSKGVEGHVPPDARLIFVIDLIDLEKRKQP